MELKIAFVLILLDVTSVFAVPSYSQVAKVSLNIEQKSLEQVMDEIEVQSEFYFIFNQKQIDVNRIVDIRADNELITDVLPELFNGTDVNYAIFDRKILLTTDPIESVPLASSSMLDPQKNFVKGTVTDATTGDVMPGVNVVLLGTNFGTITDTKGNYTIEVPDASGSLQFSFIGYITMEIPVAGKSVVNAALAADVKNLGEVVVTALGIERSKKSLNYSTQMVNMESVTTAKNVDMATALQGKVAGVSIIGSTGASGVSGSSQIVIRGYRSISGENQPLIVVDGIPNATGGGGIAGINPDDIESLNVLKGHSASALYGSAANNGVIMITTKKGKKGAAKIEVNSSLNFDIPYLYPSFQNEYAQGAGGVYSPTTEYLSWGPKMKGQTVTNWTGEQTTLDPQPDNVKDFFRTGYTATNSFSYSAGTEKMTAYVSYANTKAQGVLEDNVMMRHNVNLRLESQLLEHLKMDFKINYTRQDVEDKPVTGDDLYSPMLQLVKMPRSLRTSDISKYSYYDETGSLQQNSWYPESSNNINPYWSMYGYENPSHGNNINTFASLRYDIAPWLYIQARGGLIASSSDEEEKQYWDVPYINGGKGGYMTKFGKGTSWNGDVLLSANKNITEDFKVSLSLGAEIKDGQGRSMKSTASGLTSENKFALAYAQTLTSSDDESHTQTQSAYGFGQISFRDYLFLDVTARNDWNSTLPSPYNYFYPSVGLSGILSEMITLPEFVTFAKVRATYAEVGNGAGFAQIFQDYGSGTNGPAGTISPSSTRVATNLIPEKSKSWELGTDMKFFDNRLGFDFTWYKTNTYNQLMNVNMVPSSGYSNGYINSGNIQNKGIEVALYAVPVKLSDFSWEANVNFSRNINEVISLTDKLPKYEIQAPNLSIGECWVLEGRPFGEMYTKGFERDDNGNVVVAANGIPVIETTSDTNLGLYLGNFNYDWRGSITNSFSYKNWDMSFMVDLNYGGVRGSSTEAWMLACGTSEASLVGREGGILVDGVFADGTKNNVTVDAESYYRALGGRISNGCGELFSHDATNSRLREFTLGYNIPLKSNVVKGLRVSAVGRNLFYIYNDCKWFDPDMTYDSGRTGQGAESAFLPGMRTIGFNLKLTL
ncbi:MAG TPA: SusC/RagA family TonB-linked outer membrane protein [Bacteroidales bacterium]|nr:SusC/RagA family TonB-linked outer membrane protein [Bacteroidales bacterium]